MHRGRGKPVSPHNSDPISSSASLKNLSSSKKSNGKINWMGMLTVLLLWILLVYFCGTFFHKAHKETFKLRELGKKFPQIFDPVEIPFKFGLAKADQILHNEESFKCRDGSETFPLHFFNDDYCDCKDGSDEPGTTACSHIYPSKFYCNNNGKYPKRIPSSFVNDGVCGTYFFFSYECVLY